MPLTVTDADARDDAQWFAAHPSSQYRVRPGWVVRRMRDVFLRTPIAADGADADSESLWWSAAWPELDPEIRDKLAKAARRRSKGEQQS